MARIKTGHRSDEITSYLSDTLEPEERAALEAHLDTCEECQDEVAAQQALFERTNEALAFKPKRTIDEQVARFEREVAEERAAKGEASARVRPAAQMEARRSRRRWAIPVGLALAASAAAVFVLLGHPGIGGGPDTIAHGAVDAGDNSGVMTSPRPQVKVDAGVDGGQGTGH